ncbi:MAG: LacI family transcriptional regulator, partial [Lachnospiraceae bacterium]|nr:LacI family transcriptional regulator [Lachnospiraceae bacterium]
MVRLKDVAMRCGVSTATVSKALSDKSDIGKETKERIRRVCEEMGYLPNASAGMLRSHRSYNLGIVHREQDRTGLRHAYFSPIIDSFRDYAENHGYDVTFIGNGKGGTMSYLERARYRGVDGLLLAGASYARPGIEELIESDIPVVLIDHSDSK